jgi:hypothetical protein
MLLGALKAALPSSGIGAHPRSEWGSLFYSLAMPWAHPGFMQYARGITPEEGAKTMIYLATSPDVAPQSGQYFIECKAAQCSKAAADADAAAKLWSLSEAMTS